ncbi:MAG: 5-methylthioadenosine/S-adenosylhomocysteine deaminase [Alphaproteobacteria bacterium]|jgi:cytosine/adenosine deaminase-related metal-dependent hydrolase|nr:5-methylthioadenosine/S-adenosylhomocysteine deaminase [Alphaproteobacteria bacterium]
MKTPHHKNPMLGAMCACCEEPVPLAATATSRRRFLKAGAAIVAGGAALPMLPASAPAQGDPDLARLQGERRILIKGGVVLTLDRQVGDFANADVLIEDGKIREIRPNIAASGDGVAVVDAGNRILIPGFVDTHVHSYQGLLRGFMADGLLNPDYNRDVQTTLTPVYQAADAYAGMLVTALAMIDIGTTAIVDISQCSHTPEHSDAMIRALQESGIRAVHSYHRGAGPAHQYPQDIKRLQKTYFSSTDQLLTLALTANLNADVYKLAREVGVPIVQHLVGADLNAQVQELARAGLMKAGDEYIHCLGINAATWKQIKDTGGHVSLCTLIDMTMGHGTPTIQDALEHGFRPSLSSDHGVTITQDFFTLMRTTFAYQRLQILQRKRGGEQNLPPLLTCRDMLEFATIAGARCANIDRKVGTLTPGKDADIVMLKADRFDIWPLNNAPGAVVNLMNPGHVDSVFIAGKVKKWRGTLVGVDVARVMRLVQEARDGVMRRANFQVNMLG